MTTQTTINGEKVEVSGRAAPIKTDIFAKHAESEENQYIVLERNEFDEEPEIIAHRKIEEYDSSKVMEIGKELAEEME